MVELRETSPCAGLLPMTLGAVSLEEVVPGPMASLSAYGEASALGAALEKFHGMAWPAANRSSGAEGARAIWFGRKEVMLIGVTPDPALAKHGAVVDQSDGWSVVSLSGAGAEDVLARLVPVDLRDRVFKRGHTARTQLGHMHASITRTGASAFMIMVFRSMAGTLVHDLKVAMAAVAARG